ncbi:PREDICTED: inactive peptidyl-prolyl cis-trans isomerase shutdown-like, partial [Wasmannia auropunctata]|uniref:inactive peptidyl-prolyl cis-trans isomerase shutdown-like n=1 Tax=Wasmannia auropunctata TaxID=64793 RepID=UPI0005F06DB0
FLMHPDYAYGAMGCPPRVPPNKEVVFVVHLIDYVDDDGCAQTYQNLNEEEKRFSCVKPFVMHMFATAKGYCNKYNYKQAIREYRKIIDRCHILGFLDIAILKDSNFMTYSLTLEAVKLNNEAEEKEINEQLSRACTNLGICYNRENFPLKACMILHRVPIPSAKTHYHHGKALLTIGEYNASMTELQKALVLDPRNETIRKAIQTTNVKQREYLEIEKRLLKNCFKSKEEQNK